MDRFDVDVALQAALDRLTMLADVGAALAGTLDGHEGVLRAGRVLAGRLGDWCAVDLLGAGGALDRIVITSRGLGGSVTEEQLPAAHDAEPLGRALAGAGPLLLSAAETAAAAAADPALALLAQRGAHSAVITPLRAHREVLGSLTVARVDPSRPLDATDAALAQEVAGRIALATENARLHRDATRIAERLQRALLTELPAPGALRLSGRYVPAQATAEVGGDWYDAFVLPQGDVALIIGDVAGHDLRAAVTMGQLRNILRGIACDREEPPGVILHRLDRANQTLYPATLATCVYALVKGEGDGWWHLKHANAGHPYPLLITERGETHFLTGAHGPLLGVAPQSARASASDRLPPGSTLLLYTDGLIEHPGRPLDHGMIRLRQHAAALARAPLETLCDELLITMAPDGRDDIALLALRLPPG